MPRTKQKILSHKIRPGSYNGGALDQCQAYFWARGPQRKKKIFAGHVINNTFC